MTGPTKGGIGCCGSPTERLMARWPGFTSANSSASRTNGERVSTRGGGGEIGSALFIGCYGVVPPPSWHHRWSEVKTRLTNGGGRFQSPQGAGVIADEGLRAPPPHADTI